MAQIDTTDLRPFAAIKPTVRTDARVRTATIAAGCVGAGILGLLWLFIEGRFDPHGFAARILVSTLVLLVLVGFHALNTRSAVAELRRDVVAAVVQQLSIIFASQVVRALQAQAEGRQYRAAVAVPRFEALAEQQDALTKEVARLRGQTNIGLRELTEAMQRVEAFVKADITVAYDLGAQSTRDN